MTSFWDEKAGRKGLQAVLDYEDTSGRKNAYIDYVSRLALDKAARPQAVDRVLDFGCGTGRNSRHLARIALDVTGVDTSEAMVERARAENSYLANARFLHVPSDSQRRPFETNSFDLVVPVWVLQHIIDQSQLERTAAELVRVCKQDGRIVILERLSDQPLENGMPQDYIRRRTLHDYSETFAAAGATIERAFPFRSQGRICGSRIINAVVNRGVAPPLNPLVARLDLKLQAKLSGDAQWSDFAMRFTKSGSRS